MNKSTKENVKLEPQPNNEPTADEQHVCSAIGNTNVSSSFFCKGCGHELDISFSIRTIGFCYLCDPNVTLEELLSGKEINE
jgi:hypothetical protein